MRINCSQRVLFAEIHIYFAVFTKLKYFITETYTIRIIYPKLKEKHICQKKDLKLVFAIRSENEMYIYYVLFDFRAQTVFSNGDEIFVVNSTFSRFFCGLVGR